MAPVSLFDDDDDNDDTTAKVTINKTFARDYESKKLRQELKEHDDDSSDDEEEDEAAVLLTTKLDTTILKTIHALRSKDERIYDPKATFFETEEENVSKAAVEKPKFIKDVIREQVLEDMETGGATDMDNDDPQATSHLMYDETQQEARRAFLNAVNDDDDNMDEPIVVLKSKRATPEDETEFMQELEKLEQTKGGDTYVDPKGEVKDGEAFLMNFFKQRPWKEEDDDSSDGASNDEVPMKTGHNDDSDEESSLAQLEDAETFEAEYNFRFEQAAHEMSGADHSLQTYSRVNTISLRRPDDRRKAKRVERAERKAAERKAKEDQLRRLKQAKRKEMEEKMVQLKSVMGSNQDIDDEAIMKMLEGDFDPDQFESLMKDTYNEDFYNQEDPEWKNDRDVKKSLDLEFPDDEEGDLYDDGNEDDDEDQKMPADVGEEEYDDEEEEMWPDEEPPETELEQKVRAKMEDELYKLDYEDIVAGMPTRFKYRKVEPNNYGLSTEEILLARDTTLKQFVSLKKMAPYAEGEYRVHGAKRRKFRELLKEDIEEQTKELEDSQPKEVVKKKKRRLRKKEKREAAGKEDATMDTEPIPSEDTTPTDKKKKEKKHVNSASTQNESSSADKLDKLSPTTTEKAEAPLKPSNSDAKEPQSEEKDKKKKKKRKRKHKVQGVSAARMEAYGL